MSKSVINGTDFIWDDMYEYQFLNIWIKYSNYIGLLTLVMKILTKIHFVLALENL